MDLSNLLLLNHRNDGIYDWTRRKISNQAEQDQEYQKMEADLSNQAQGVPSMGINDNEYQAPNVEQRRQANGNLCFYLERKLRSIYRRQKEKSSGEAKRIYNEKQKKRSGKCRA